MTEPSLLYVYGVVRNDFDAARAPAGLDDLPAEVVRGESYAALVSRLPTARYAPEEIERRSGEMDWVSPRAMAHDRVLTWAQEHGGIIPMPMFSLWGDAGALIASLAQRDEELRRSFARVDNADEFGLRLHRRDQEMLAKIDELDPRIASLRAEASAASPGQRYLLERKIAEQAKLSLRAASQRIAKEVFAALQPLAREAVTRPLTASSAVPAEGTLVLNAAFLVDRARFDAFRAELTRQLRDLEPRGLAFDFTGPWPPYHFVS